MTRAPIKSPTRYPTKSPTQKPTDQPSHSPVTPPEIVPPKADEPDIATAFGKCAAVQAEVEEANKKKKEDSLLGGTTVMTADMGGVNPFAPDEIPEVPLILMVELVFEADPVSTNPAKLPDAFTEVQFTNYFTTHVEAMDPNGNKYLSGTLEEFRDLNTLGELKFVSESGSVINVLTIDQKSLSYTYTSAPTPVSAAGRRRLQSAATGTSVTEDEATIAPLPMSNVRMYFELKVQDIGML